MDELNKKLHILKQKIRMAVNESGLPLSVVEIVLDSLRAEVLQNELFVLNNSIVNSEQAQPVGESEVKADGIHENELGE